MCRRLVELPSRAAVFALDCQPTGCQLIVATACVCFLTLLLQRCESTTTCNPDLTKNLDVVRFSFLRSLVTF